jgi:hypothetical protein
MIDPLRIDRLPTSGEVPERERDARIEDLLLTGLDHYFLGQHELAISVWTRVLFLDRGHARARAYIERARGAIAERQREGEELLHSGVAAFDRGDVGAARHFLTSAVERGAPGEEAIALLQRLERLENVTPQVQPGGSLAGVPAASIGEISNAGAATRASRLAWIATGLCAGLALAALAAWLWNGAHGLWMAAPRERPTATAPAVPEKLPLPSSAEASLTRAMRLNESGRLHDALDVLRAIRHGDPLRPQADALRAAIQRQLLDSARAMQESVATGGRSPGPPPAVPLPK